MIIEENQLRPPSPKEMEARRMTLERVRISYEIDWDQVCVSPDKATGPCDCPKTEGSAHTYALFQIPVLELIEFCKDWGIPYEARLEGVGDDNDLQLDWSHIVQCAGCKQWIDSTQEHDTTDTSLHGYIIRGREAMTERIKERDKGRLK